MSANKDKNSEECVLNASCVQVRHAGNSLTVDVRLFVLIVGYCVSLLWDVCQEMSTALISPARSGTW